MKVLIIEDEENSYKLLKYYLEEIDESIHVTGPIPSIEEAVRFLHTNPEPDMIFLDIKLNDGLSFEIFQRIKVKVPVIFTTAYDTYMIEAFKTSSIDYLLKPVSKEKISNALNKFKTLRHFFSQKNIEMLINQLEAPKRQRIVVKKGQDFQAINVENIAYFFVDHKIVFCVDKYGKKHITEWTYLNDIFEALDEESFYKANRKFIINFDYVKSFKPLEYGKTLVEMEVQSHEEIIISQDNSADFRSRIRGVRNI